MERFKLIGNTAIFVLIKRYDAAGFIPSVHGITEDGAKQTCARVADIEWLG